MQILKALITIFIFAAALPVWAMEDSVLPEKAQTVCAKDSDCILVSDSCSQCCGRVAIAKSSQVAFEKRVRECSRKWKGPICDCMMQEAVAKCKSGMCSLEPK